MYQHIVCDGYQIVVAGKDSVWWIGVTELVYQSQKTKRFHVTDFVTLSNKRRSHLNIVLLSNADKRTLHSKILGILQTDMVEQHA